MEINPITVPFLDGWRAQKRGIPLLSNPFHGHAQAYSFDQWEAGWIERHQSIQHGLDMSLDWQDTRAEHKGK